MGRSKKLIELDKQQAARVRARNQRKLDKKLGRPVVEANKENVDESWGSSMNTTVQSVAQAEKQTTSATPPLTQAPESSKSTRKSSEWASLMEESEPGNLVIDEESEKSIEKEAVKQRQLQEHIDRRKNRITVREELQAFIEKKEEEKEEKERKQNEETEKRIAEIKEKKRKQLESRRKAAEDARRKCDETSSEEEDDSFTQPESMPATSPKKAAKSMRMIPSDRSESRLETSTISVVNPPQFGYHSTPKTTPVTSQVTDPSKLSAASPSINLHQTNTIPTPDFENNVTKIVRKGQKRKSDSPLDDRQKTQNLGKRPSSNSAASVEQNDTFRSIQNSSFELTKSDEEEVENEVTLVPEDATKIIGHKQNPSADEYISGTSDRERSPRQVSTESNAESSIANEQAKKPPIVSSKKQKTANTKQGRGRPRKSRPDDEVVNDAEEDEDAAESSADQVFESEKLVSNESSAESSTEKEQAKKPAIISSKKQKTANTKRGKGRPKKSRSVGEGVIDNEEKSTELSRKKKKRRSSIRFDDGRNETHEIPSRYDQQEGTSDHSPDETTLIDTTAKTLDRRDSINSTQIPEDAEAIIKSGTEKIIQERKDLACKLAEQNHIIRPSTPDTPDVRRSKRVKFKPGCLKRSGPALSEKDIKEGNFRFGNFHLQKPTTGTILGGKVVSKKTSRERSPGKRKKKSKKSVLNHTALVFNHLDEDDLLTVVDPLTKNIEWNQKGQTVQMPSFSLPSEQFWTNMDTNEIKFNLENVLSNEIYIKTVVNWGDITKGELIFGSNARKEETTSSKNIVFEVTYGGFQVILNGQTRLVTKGVTFCVKSDNTYEIRNKCKKRAELSFVMMEERGSDDALNFSIRGQENLEDEPDSSEFSEEDENEAEA